MQVHVLARPRVRCYVWSLLRDRLTLSDEVTATAVEGQRAALTSQTLPSQGPSSQNPPSDDLQLLVTEHSEAIYRVALSIVRDHALAEDVTQDTLIKAWQALPSFRGDSSLKSWVLRIAHNTAISALRRRRDVLSDPAELPEPPARESVEQQVEQNEALAHFQEALNELDELSRSVIVLRELEHLSYDEIAETLGVPLPTVKTRILRARRTLASALGEWKP
jgi:RNA polymerase sigma-70 factor (ECF subfamily)